MCIYFPFRLFFQSKLDTGGSTMHLLERGNEKEKNLTCNGKVSKGLNYNIDLKNWFFSSGLPFEGNMHLSMAEIKKMRRKVKITTSI